MARWKKVWFDSVNSELKNMVEQGLNTGEIAEKLTAMTGMKITRNAAKNQAKKLGLTLRGHRDYSKRIIPKSDRLFSAVHLTPGQPPEFLRGTSQTLDWVLGEIEKLVNRQKSDCLLSISIRRVGEQFSYSGGIHSIEPGVDPDDPTHAKEMG